MKTSSAPIGLALAGLVVAALVFPMLLLAWPDPEFCTRFDDLPATSVTDETVVTVLEDPGTIKVMHGTARASLNTGNFIKVPQSAELPRYADQATVFLNGWRLGYLGGDHHVLAMAAFIRNIKPGLGKITWDGMGILADDGTNKPYEWSYHFTVIAWNYANLHATVNHTDADEFCKTKQPGISDNFFWARNANMPTSLSVFPTFIFGTYPFQRAAVLPRGFGVAWTRDHHVLQVAYNLDFSETFIENLSYKKALGQFTPSPTPGALVDSGYMSWNTYTILKDNDDRRDYFFGEVVSGLGGDDVHSIQPPFSITPFDSSAGALGGSGVKTKDVVIESVPYEYVIPMLTGWDVGYSGSDQHVKDIGIWIDTFQYDKVPGAVAGTLRYRVSSILRDDDDFPDNYFRHKVTMLGLRSTPTRGTGTVPRIP